MNALKKILLTGLFAVLVSACTANRVQRSYDEELVHEETTVIIIHEPVYIPQPVVIVQPQPETPKTKVRKNGENNNAQKTQRESSNNNNSNVRNNSGQRNTKSRGK